jgi:hypothetical protein
MPDLDQPIEYVKGIGPRKAELLKKAFSVTTVGDHDPTISLSGTSTRRISRFIKNIKPTDEWVLIRAKVTNFDLIGSCQRPARCFRN